MLYSELRNYLVQATSVETVDLFDRGIEILEKFEIEELMDAYEFALGEATSLGEVAVIDALHLTFTTQLDDLLVEHGVYLKEDTLTQIRITLLEGLWRLTQHDEPEHLLGILDAAQSPDEAFCELMAFVTTESEDNILSFLERADLSLISALRSLVLKQSETIEIAKDIAKQIKDYAIFKSAVSQQVSYSDRFFKSPASIGLPYLVYVNAYVADLHLETADTKTNTQQVVLSAARDLLGLCVLSEETSDSALAVIREHLELIYTDINLVTKLDIALLSLITEFNNVKTRSL